MAARAHVEPPADLQSTALSRERARARTLLAVHGALAERGERAASASFPLECTTTTPRSALFSGHGGKSAAIDDYCNAIEWTKRMPARAQKVLEGLTDNRRMLADLVAVMEWVERMPPGSRDLLERIAEAGGNAVDCAHASRTADGAGTGGKTSPTHEGGGASVPTLNDTAGTGGRHAVRAPNPAPAAPCSSSCSPVHQRPSHCALPPAKRACLGSTSCGDAKGTSHAGKQTSRFRGVSWNRRLGKYRAAIRVGHTFIHLGLFDIEVAAARAYDEKARKLGRPVNIAASEGEATVHKGLGE